MCFFWIFFCSFWQPLMLESYLSFRIFHVHYIGISSSLQYSREVFSLSSAVQKVCLHTLLGSNQLTGANNCPNGLFKREMGPSGPHLWLAVCLFHPENLRRVRILSRISSCCCADIESVSSGFRPKRPRPGSQQSGNRALYGEIGSGPVIKSPFVRLWCRPVRAGRCGRQLNLCDYNAGAMQVQIST